MKHTQAPILFWLLKLATSYSFNQLVTNTCAGQFCLATSFLKLAIQTTECYLYMPTLHEPRDDIHTEQESQIQHFAKTKEHTESSVAIMS